MLSKFGVPLPAKINTQIRNAMKRHNIIDEVNVIRMGDFDIFTIGHDGLPHIRLANISGKWRCKVVNSHRLDSSADVLEEFNE